MKEIILTFGKSALVNDRWYWKLRLMPWYAKESSGGFYAATSLSRKNRHHYVLRMHQLILGLVPREYCPHCEACDYFDECAYIQTEFWEGHHLNGDTMDNREENLEKMTKEEHTIVSLNGGNIFKPRPKPLRPATKFVGVRWNLERGIWQASWKSGTGEFVVGYYEDDVSAALAYDYAARRLLRKPVRVNFTVDAADIPF
jgi:hypothetical protein